MSQTVSNAVAQREQGPAALIERYSNDFARVLPSHVKPETWVRIAQSALRQNARLAEAARNDPGSFLAALLDAARLGLEPGTEQYYLVPFKDRQRGYVVQGIAGYQGEIELMYRSGAVRSVVVELVKQRDVFIWRPGAYDDHRPPRWEGPQTKPYHEVDWFGDRGDTIGVYAYAELATGGTSKVVVLNRRDIEQARNASASYKLKPEASPWTTHYDAMVAKTAAHRLRKWVPTSAEYRAEILRATAEAHRIAAERNIPPATPDVPDEVVDGEVIEQDWPEVTQPPQEQQS